MFLQDFDMDTKTYFMTVEFVWFFVVVAVVVGFFC